MDKKMENFILDLLKNHNLSTIATIREDGYPQANTVTYASDGFIIYFLTGPNTQKVKNIKRSNKVSLTIDRNYNDWNKIKGLSMAATCEVLTNTYEKQKAMDCLTEKFPALKKTSKSNELMALVKITPKIISVLNYELGFGHKDLVEV
jgi:general stress protein 26